MNAPAALILPGYNPVYEDDIDPADYGTDTSSISGFNGWTTTGPGDVILRTPYDGSRFNAQASGVTGTASRAAVVNPGDTVLQMNQFIRYRESGGGYNGLQLTQLTSSGTVLLSVGTGQGGNLITGTAVTSYTENTDISAGNHLFYWLELSYDEATGDGSIDGHQRTNGDDYSITPLINYATFTASLDVDSIDGISYQTADTSGFLQQIGVGTVPEPSVGLLGALGLMGLMRRRRA